jgi:hypothetical protein
VQVFHVYDVEFGFCLELRVFVFHPSRYELTVVLVRCCGLSKSWYDGDG